MHHQRCDLTSLRFFVMGTTDRKTANYCEVKGVREFARMASLTGGPGMISCGCSKTGKCTNCKCVKAGRKCHSGCKCSRFCACTNKEPVE